MWFSTVVCTSNGLWVANFLSSPLILFCAISALLCTLEDPWFGLLQGSLASDQLGSAGGEGTQRGDQERRE
jgi:hypothetical protein